MYDVIVVGARVAGASTAMLLARKGLRVLLVDRARFPSDIRHGHLLHRHGPRKLREWGLLDEVAEATPALTAAITDFDDFPLLSTDLVEDGLPWAYAPRRSTFDAILVRAAVEAGVELREGFTVDSYNAVDGAITGITGRAGGPPVAERARITVGADGRHSPLARTVGARSYFEADTLLCYYFSYWADVEASDFELYQSIEARRGVFAFRTEGGLLAVFVAAPVEELPALRRDIEGSFMASLDAAAPLLAERVRSGRRVEGMSGATSLPNFFRQPYGPGWALVGDAGLHKDPWLALGMCDAMRDAELLADAIGRGLEGGADLDEQLAGFHATRDALTEADYRENLALARFEPRPPMLGALRQALRDRPEESTRFFKARMRMIPFESFFNPENVGRIVGQATAPSAAAGG
ncbi:MAG: FAD-dependent monooxygenase [Dehalococcoidia bacterium]